MTLQQLTGLDDTGVYFKSST